MSPSRPRRGDALRHLLVLLVGLSTAAIAGEATPALRPPGGSYPAPVVVHAVAMPSDDVRYTVDGSDPTPRSWPLSRGMVVTDPTTVKAQAFAGGVAVGPALRQRYDVATPLTTARPTFMPAPGTVAPGTIVTLATPTPGAVIRYTLDGSDPTRSSPRYGAGIRIDGDTVICARAFGGTRRFSIGFAQIDLPMVFPSGVAIARYLVHRSVPAPVLTPAPGRYLAELDVAGTCPDAQAQLRYTLDGTPPSASSQLLPAALHLARTTRLTVAAFDGGLASPAVSATYELQVPAPTITPPGGSFHDALVATLADPDPAATVRYTLDGAVPDGSSLIASAPVAIDRSATLTVVAMRDGWTASAAPSAVFALSVLPPVLDPPSTTILHPLVVNASCATPAATVRYTLDGTVPTSDSPVLIDLVVAATTTVTTRAFRDGFDPSAVVSASYTLAPTVRFRQRAVSVGEADGLVRLQIDADRVLTAPVTCAFVYTPETATPGDDAPMADGSVTIPAGASSAAIDVPISDDSLHENDETFLITLTGGNGVVVDAQQAVARVTIIDEDPVPRVSFGATALTVHEADGAAAIPIMLDRPSAFPVSVDIGFAGGTARAGLDYRATARRVTLQAGQIQTTFSIPLVDDGLAESPETILLALTNAAGASIGDAARCRIVVLSDLAANVVADWFAHARDVVASASIDPIMASRLYALLGVAQRRAVHAVAEGDAAVSVPGAVTAASWSVLAGLVPAQATRIRGFAEHMVAAETWSGYDSEDVLSDASPGRAAALTVLQQAGSDGSATIWTGTPPVGPGLWYASWSYVAPPTRPLWGHVRPWFLTSGDALRPSPPPTFGSPAFMRALVEVRAIADNRTADQVTIAGRWNDGPGSATPPGHWCAIAEQELLAHRLDEGASAEIMGLLGATMMDAGIACWDCKYAYWLIRPYQADRSIVTAVGQPNFPSYVSGHATFSAAAAEILASAFPERAAALRAMAEEAALSRLYGGIHYRFDNDSGLALGRAVAAVALADAAHGAWTADLAPRIVVTAPVQSAILTTTPTLAFTVTGTTAVAPATIAVDVTDAQGVAAPVQLQVTATSATAANGSARFAAALAPGSYLVRIRATDTAGRVGTAMHSFGIDTGAAPQVVISAPADGATVGMSQPVRVHGHVSQPVAALLLNGAAIPIAADGGFSVDLPVDPYAMIRTPLTLVGGLDEIAVQAIGPAGRSSRVAVTILVDDRAPRPHIVSPADGDLVAGPTATVIGTVEDIVLGVVDSQHVAVSVNGVAATVANGSFAAGGVPIAADGRLVATATDAAGNTATHAVTVRFGVAPGLRVRITGGDQQQAPIGSALPQAIQARVEDAYGAPAALQAVTFAVGRGDGTLVEGTDDAHRQVTVLTDAGGLAAVHWRIGTRAGLDDQSLRASAVGALTSATAFASAVAGPVSAVLVASGDDQTAAVGTTLPQPLVAWVADIAGNPVAGVPVQFTVQGEDGLVETDRGAQTWSSTATVVSDVAGRASVYASIAKVGVDNLRITASASSGAAASFAASGVVSSGDPADTALAGVVMTTEHRPLAGVTLSIDGTIVGAQSGADGGFRLVGAPAGHRHLVVTGTTADHDDVRYPNLGFEIDLVSGATVTLPRPIYLPTMDLSQLHLAGGDTEVVLPLPGVPGAEVVIAPHSTIRGDGIRGPVYMYTSPVNAQALPMAPPNGYNPPLSATLQPSGTRLDPPATVRWPNLQGMAPGAQAILWSFDHDLGEFVSQGTATVSEDGALLVTDAGSGIGKAGWFYPSGPPIPVGDVTGHVPPQVISIRVAEPFTDPHVEIAGTAPTFTLTAVTDVPALDGDITWTTNGGSFAGGATTTTGKTVSWTMSPDIVSAISDSIVITAKAARGGASHYVTAFRFTGDTILAAIGADAASSDPIATLAGNYSSRVIEQIAIRLNRLPANAWRLAWADPMKAEPLPGIYAELRQPPVVRAIDGDHPGLAFTVAVTPAAQSGSFLLECGSSGSPSSEKLVIGTAVTGPEATCVSYISHFVPANGGILLKVWKAYKQRYGEPPTQGRGLKLLYAMRELARSANPDPPDRFGRTPEDWSAFLATKEYRGWAKMHVELIVDNGKILAHREVLETDEGFTPIRMFSEFERADGDSSNQVIPSDTDVRVKLESWGRLPKLARFANTQLAQADAPWISRVIDYTVHADGTYEIRFGGSYFPSHLGYIDGRQLWVQPQDNARLGEFMYLIGDALFAGPGNLTPSNLFTGPQP